MFRSKKMAKRNIDDVTLCILSQLRRNGADINPVCLLSPVFPTAFLIPLIPKFLIPYENACVVVFVKKIASNYKRAHEIITVQGK